MLDQPTANEMSIGNGEWKLWRNGKPFPQRFTGRFEDDGKVIVGRWKKAEDGTNYTTDFDLTYTRVERNRRETIECAS
jgi:hypothetical protein